MAFLTPSNLQLVRYCTLLALLLCCAFTYVAKGKVYNAVTLPALFVGLVLSAAMDGLPTDGHYLRESLVGLAIGGGFLGVFFLLRGLGGGDVKFMAAIGALSANWRFTVVAMVYTAFVGGIMALILLVWKKQLMTGLGRSLALIVSPRRGRSGTAPERLTIPYGLALAVGTLWAWMAEIALK